MFKGTSAAPVLEASDRCHSYRSKDGGICIWFLAFEPQAGTVTSRLPVILVTAGVYRCVELCVVPKPPSITERVVTNL